MATRLVAIHGLCVNLVACPHTIVDTQVGAPKNGTWSLDVRLVATIVTLLNLLGDTAVSRI